MSINMYQFRKSEEKYKEVLNKWEFPQLRLTEGKSDNSNGSYAETTNTSFLKTGIQWGLLTTLLLTGAYFWGFLDNSKWSASGKSDPAQERYDNNFAKNKALFEEKIEQGCGNLTEAEQKIVQKIEELFAAVDTASHKLGWMYFNMLDEITGRDTKANLLSISTINQYADSIMNTQAELCKCLWEINIMDIETNKKEQENSIVWEELVWKLNHQKYAMNFPNMKDINLIYKKLSNFPWELLSFQSSLQVLHLEGNYIEMLPLKIGDFANLKWLSLYANKLTELPAEIGNLMHLEELYLTENDLETLPVEMRNLMNLELLELSDNNFTEETIEWIKEVFWKREIWLYL